MGEMKRPWAISGREGYSVLSLVFSVRTICGEGNK